MAGFRRGIMKAGAKDPRFLVRNTQPYDPSIQPDQVQFSQKIATEAGNFVPLADAVDQASQSFASQSRIQADYTPFPFFGTLPQVANGIILIPRNPNRSDLIVQNLSAKTIYISFGPTSSPFYGFIIPTTQAFFLSNGIIPINDIYINAGAADQAGIAILGYEGIPAITAA